MKSCSKCHEVKSLDEFHSRSAMCKTCHRLYLKAHYKNNKQYYVDKAMERTARVKQENRVRLLDYFKENPCVDCGNDDPEVLEFDHRDETLKEHNISNLVGYRWEKIYAEIIKCDVRCCNCHRKRTRRQFGHWTVELPEVYPLATNQLKG